MSEPPPPYDEFAAKGYAPEKQPGAVSEYQGDPAYLPQQQPGYGPPGYPQQAPGYPPGYPPQQQPAYPGYPQQAGYPPQQPGYPQQPAYPQQQQTSNVTVVTAQPVVATATVAAVAYQAKPANYLALSLVSFLCCCWLFGLIALFYSLQVDSSWNVGDHNGAWSASRKAKSWNIASIVTGIVVGVAIGVIYGIQYSVTIAY